MGKLIPSTHKAGKFTLKLTNSQYSLSDSCIILHLYLKRVVIDFEAHSFSLRVQLATWYSDERRDTEEVLMLNSEGLFCSSAQMSESTRTENDIQIIPLLPCVSLSVSDERQRRQQNRHFCSPFPAVCGVWLKDVCKDQA